MKTGKIDNSSKKAVAIRYMQGLPAPFICAKGKGEIAKSLVQIAKKYGIETVIDPELIDTLIEIDVGTFIPEELYEIIAELLVFVKRVKGPV